MSVPAKGIFIVGAKRTAFGTFGGVYRDTSATELMTAAMTASLKEAGVAPEQVDTVVVGHVMSACQSDGIYTPRHSALKAGIPQEKPVLGINKLCGSGFQSIINSAQDILTGAAEISLAGGVENMSQAPFAVRGVRFGTALGSNYAFEDTLWASLLDSYCDLPMGMTAEKLGDQFGITRDEVDNFALRSQQRWKAANDAGVFKEEIVPLTVTIKRKEVQVSVDEHPRPQTTIEALKKLSPVFKKEGLVTAGTASIFLPIANDAGVFKEEIVPLTVTIKRKEVQVSVDEHPRPQTTIEALKKLSPVFKKEGLVTAGTASGISDGAGAIILASEEAAKGLKPLARLVGWSCVGVDPSVMGVGPVPAIEKLLKVTKMTLNDIDLIETLACAKALKIDMDKLNVNGGATALGHPFGASGARITAHLVYELRRRGLKRAIGSSCIGGGQGIAIMIESV